MGAASATKNGSRFCRICQGSWHTLYSSGSCFLPPTSVAETRRLLRWRSEPRKELGAAAGSRRSERRRVPRLQAAACTSLGPPGRHAEGHPGMNAHVTVGEGPNGDQWQPCLSCRLQLSEPSEWFPWHPHLQSSPKDLSFCSPCVTELEGWEGTTDATWRKSCACERQREMETETETDRETGRDREPDRERQRRRQRDKQRERDTHTYTQRLRNGHTETGGRARVCPRIVGLGPCLGL